MKINRNKSRIQSKKLFEDALNYDLQKRLLSYNKGADYINKQRQSVESVMPSYPLEPPLDLPNRESKKTNEFQRNKE